MAARLPRPHCGTRTPISVVVAQLVYGAILGGPTSFRDAGRLAGHSWRGVVMVEGRSSGRHPGSGLWPALPLDGWQNTYATLHRWTQIVGKVRLARMPWVNHSWHVTL